MIYLVNKYGFGPVGHYWTCDFNLRLAMRELNMPYIYVNPTASKAMKEDKISQSSDFLYQDLSYTEDFMKNLVEFINAREEKSNNDKSLIIFSWLPMFTENELRKLDLLTRKISIACISSKTSEAVLGKSSKHLYYGQDFFQNYQSKSLMWVWESVPDNDFSFDVRQLPDYIASLPAEQDRDWNQLSFFGLLGGHRGMAEILILSVFNPSLRIKIKGYSFSAIRCWRPFKFKVFRYSSWKRKPWVAVPLTLFSLLISLLRFLPNVDFSEIPFETEDDLSVAISKSGAFFICLKYPYASGVVMKSLYSGVPVVWNIPDGQARDVLNSNFPAGHFKYWELFIPGRFTKKMKSLKGARSTAPYSWDEYKQEIIKLNLIKS